jgi:hypothetical protein
MLMQPLWNLMEVALEAAKDFCAKILPVLGMENWHNSILRWNFKRSTWSTKHLPLLPAFSKVI